MLEVNESVITLAKSVIKQAYFESLTCKDKHIKKDYYKSIRRLARQSIIVAKDCKQTAESLVVFLEARAGGNFVSYIESNNEHELIARILAY